MLVPLRVENPVRREDARACEPPGVPTLLEPVPLARHPGPMLGSAEALQESVHVGEQQRLAEELVDPG